MVLRSYRLPTAMSFNDVSNLLEFAYNQLGAYRLEITNGGRTHVLEKKRHSKTKERRYTTRPSLDFEIFMPNTSVRGHALPVSKRDLEKISPGSAELYKSLHFNRDRRTQRHSKELLDSIDRYFGKSDSSPA